MEGFEYSIVCDWVEEWLAEVDEGYCEMLVLLCSCLCAGSTSDVWLDDHDSPQILGKYQDMHKSCQ